MSLTDKCQIYSEYRHMLSLAEFLTCILKNVVLQVKGVACETILRQTMTGFLGFIFGYSFKCLNTLVRPFSTPLSLQFAEHKTITV